ncbi:Uncharacterized mitochondrial protein AtMg00310 [Linum perenne]
MSLVLLPNKMVNRMNSLLRRFFWSGSMVKRSIHWCKGAKLCDSRAQEGLGFRKFGFFNKALLAHRGWRLLNSPDAPWARLLKTLYFPSRNFLSASKGRRPSWIWASLVEARTTLNMGCIKVVGNGKNTSIYDDPWILDLPSFRPSDIRLGSQTVADLIGTTDRVWNNNRLQECFKPREIEAILRIPIGPTDFEDLWAWSLDPKGSFSIRSAYHTSYRISHPIPYPIRNAELEMVVEPLNPA